MIRQLSLLGEYTKQVPRLFIMMFGRRKRGNISRCISLHQVFIYPCQDWITHVKICIHVKKYFNIRIKIYVQLSRSACGYIKSNNYWSTLTRIDNIEVRVATSRFAVIPIKILTYTSKLQEAGLTIYCLTECVMVSFRLESKLSNRFALRTLTFELNWATSHYWMTQFLLCPL